MIVVVPAPRPDQPIRYSIEVPADRDVIELRVVQYDDVSVEGGLWAVSPDGEWVKVPPFGVVPAFVVLRGDWIHKAGVKIAEAPDIAALERLIRAARAGTRWP